jgi:phage FluMu gp28-like protein
MIASHLPQTAEADRSKQFRFEELFPTLEKPVGRKGLVAILLRKIAARHASRLVAICFANRCSPMQPGVQRKSRKPRRG